MKKTFIKITMSRGTHFVLEKNKVEALLAGESQLVKIHDEDGEWTGDTLNKAHIVSTEIDHNATREHRIRATPRIGDPDEGKEPLRDIRRYRPDFIKTTSTTTAGSNKGGSLKKNLPPADQIWKPYKDDD